MPALAPAYDLVSTAHCFAGERVEDLGLKFGGSKDFHRVTVATFRRLQERLGARGVNLAECAAATVQRTVAEEGYWLPVTVRRMRSTIWLASASGIS